MSTPERSANIAASSVQTPVTGVIPQHVIITRSDGTTIESFGGGTGGTSSLDGEAFVANTTAGTPALGAYQSSPSAMTDGDLGVVAIDINRNLKVNVAAGGTAGVQYTEADTDATITGTAVMFETNTGTNALGVVSSATPLPVTLANTGANATPLVVDLGANNDVTVTGSVAVTNAGTFAVQESGAALTALQLIDNLVLAEDAAHVSGDPGVLGLVVRKDAAGTMVSLDGDYSPLQVDASGSLRVAVTAGAGGTEYTEGDVDTTFTGGVVLAEGPSNTATPLKVNASAHLAVDLATASVNVGVTDAGGSLTVDAPVGTPVFVRLSDGSSAIATLPVSLASVPSHAVTNAGTFVVQENGAALTSLQLIDDVVVADNGGFTDGTTKLAMAGYIYDEVAGTALTENDAAAARINVNRAVVGVMEDGATRGRYATVTASNALKVDGSAVTQPVGGVAAQGAAVSGNPVLNGFEARTTSPTAVTDGQVVRGQASPEGKQISLLGAVPALTWRYAAASGGIVNTTGVTAKTAAGAGVRNYVTRAQIINGHATTSTDVQIRDGASGTVLWRGHAQAAGGGVSCVFDPPLRGTANTLIEVACGTTGAAVYFNLQGYTAVD